MADWPSGFSGSQLATYGEVTSTSLGTTVQTNGANTKGSWVQLVAASDFDADGFYLTCLPQLGSLSSSLVDIGVGAAASEQVILSNFLYSEASAIEGGVDAYIPIPIKGGSRIAARAQCSDVNGGARVAVQIAAGDFYSSIRMGRATTYGANTADSGGINPDPGSTANTKGAWSEITSATTAPIRYALVLVGNANNAKGNGITYLADLAVGAAGSEVIVVDDLTLRTEGTSDVVWPQIFQRFVSVKSGARLAVRTQCSSGTDVNRGTVDFVVIGFD